eukprot:TRINITY_DN1412_c0_g1_i2.p2 TRINITY_DN1412_c0_g1~~TRINITY_DN1412_c0_g1_i2.p2  ORF type:complete len:318 (+),score=67.05 TRINITY_DN1412_c0_g1_i2:1331-2284(+)
MDILTHIVTHDAAFARHALLSQENATLAKLLMKQMVSDTDSGVQEQLKEVIRCLVDPEAMDQQVEKDEFLTLFYDSCIDVVMQPVVGPESVFQSYGGAVKDHCMDLLAFCVRAHGLRIKYYILRHNVAQKVLRLMSAREKYLVTSTVRFFRALVGMKEEVYDRYIVKHNLFAPIMKAFTENGDRYNLLNSTVLDLVEFIRKFNRTLLIKYLVEDFVRKDLARIDYVDIFSKLLFDYEGQPENASASAAAAAAVEASKEPPPSTKAQLRDNLSDSDSEYFNAEDDENDVQQPMPSLVDYVSDDDEFLERDSPNKRLKT